MIPILVIVLGLIIVSALRCACKSELNIDIH